MIRAVLASEGGATGVGHHGSDNWPVAVVIAIPSSSRDSMERSSYMRLRAIASAGQQYILENHVTHVSYSQLVGEYFSSMPPVKDETYDHVIIEESGGTIIVEIDGYEFVYTY